MNSIAGKTILITGGTGSFGQAMVSYALTHGAKEIRIFSRDEKKQEEVRHYFNDSRLHFYIGDVRDRNTLRAAAKGSDLCFSAAALKQVPSCEFYPLEAVKTNVIGTTNTLEECCDAGVANVVVLSTDKAVYPINAMGMSKALMEKVMVAKSRQSNLSTVLCGTRYGNVMCSRGSVIPRFIDQIVSGRPITITDPSMTRFLMSLNDAVKLVEHAFTYAEPGDMFVKKAPAATVGQIASVLMDIVGKKVPVVVVGPRHGEKQFECLLSVEEKLVAEDLGDYYRIPMDNRSLNYQDTASACKSMVGLESYNSDNTERLTDEALWSVLSQLPELQASTGYIR